MLTLFTCCCCSFQVLRSKGKSPRQVIISVLTAATLLFAVNAALGRICLGIEAAHAARYVPYLMTGFLGIYFFFLSIPRHWTRRALLTVFAITLVAGAAPLRHKEVMGLVHEHNAKQGWKNCYLKTENLNYCDTSTGFNIYPAPEATHLQQKLIFLKAHRLNLYNGD
jgi:hypothetical protein